jgi:nicotinamide-nucleotide amidase
MYSPGMIRIEIITIGGEILSGRTRDTNFAFLARGLSSHGLECRWHTSVPDDRDALTDALDTSLARADVVITTGGLGATPDDITRKALATVLKRQLVLREDVLQAIEDRFARMGRTPPPNMQAQALVPLGAELIENPVGIAPGLRFSIGEGRFLYALPGVPYEMEAIAARFVLPQIAALYPESKIVERTLRTIGIPENKLAEIIVPMIPAEVGVAYLPHLGTVDLRFSLAGRPVEAKGYLDRIVAPIQARLKDAVYADGAADLEEVLGRELSGRARSIAVAESLTGGRIASRIARVAGASRYFMGGIVAYSNAAKVSILGVPDGWIREHGAVSEPVARAMAHGARDRFETDVAIATTGVAGPTGGSAEKPVGLVWFGVSSAMGTIAIKRQLPGDREQVIERTVLIALDIARRVVTGLPIA